MFNLDTTTLLLSGIKGQTKIDLEEFGPTHLIGKSHIFYHIDTALAKSEELI